MSFPKQCRLIVSQMSNTQCELFNWLLVPLAACVAIIILLPSLEMATLLIMSGVATVAHIHYGIYVVCPAPSCNFYVRRPDIVVTVAPF